MPETANAVFGVPTKLKDPGSFIIDITIGDRQTAKAMFDNGASINLMPYSIYKQLGLGAYEPTHMVIQMADRSVKHPLGIIEDVLVKVDKLIVPVDFVIMDTASEQGSIPQESK